MPLMPGNSIEAPFVLRKFANSLLLFSQRLRWLLMSEAQKEAYEAMALAHSQDRVVEKYLQAKHRLN